MPETLQGMPSSGLQPVSLQVAQPPYLKCLRPGRFWISGYFLPFPSRSGTLGCLPWQPSRACRKLGTAAERAPTRDHASGHTRSPTFPDRPPSEPVILANPSVLLPPKNRGPLHVPGASSTGGPGNCCLWCEGHHLSYSLLLLLPGLKIMAVRRRRQQMGKCLTTQSLGLHQELAPRPL